MVAKSTISQVRAGKNGRLIEIDQDVMDVCARIREVDVSLGVEWNEDSEQYRIYELGTDGKKRTVLWTPQLTPDLPDHLRMLEKTDYADAVARLDAKAERDERYGWAERRGPLHERLQHAVRKDIGAKPRIYVPRWF